MSRADTNGRVDPAVDAAIAAAAADPIVVRPTAPAQVNGHRAAPPSSAVPARPARRRGLLGRAVGALGDTIGSTIGGPVGEAVSTVIDRTVGTAVDTAEATVPALTGELITAPTVGTVVRAVPDIVKVGGELLWRTNRWTVNASLHLGSVVVQGAISGQSPHVLIDQLGTEAKHSLRELLGVADEPDPMPKELRDRIVLNGNEPQISLPDRMRALLDASSDVTFPDTGHPAYVRLLSELAPDEARILRLFAERGPQPSVDVRTKRPFGVGSQLIAPGITMIGRYAGCAHVDRVPAYLNNMFRLGLVWFSREPIPDQSLYDVLEAQEEVEAAMRKAGGGITVRRSIELTAFGANLCAMCGLLPVDESAARATKDETTRQILPPDARS
jgi:hypothetical protein